MKLNPFVKNLLAGRFVEVLKTGTYFAHKPGKVTFTTELLEQMADDYDPNYRQAVLVIGHPTMLGTEGERKAHGVVAELKTVGGSLLARFENLSDEVVELLANGHLVARSLEGDLKNRDTGRAYMTALALLGGTQPAVHTMLSAEGGKISIPFENCTDKETETESTEIDNSQPPLSTKGAANMDAAELKRLEALEAQAGEVKAFKTEITQLSESLKSFTTELEGLKAIKSETEALKASSAAFLDAQAQIEVNKATAGIPKALCPDEKKTLLSEMYKTNRAAFDIEAKAFDVMRKSFAYLTTEIVPEVVEGAPVIDRKVNAEADDYSKRLALKVRELRAADKSISIEQATKMAKEQVA